MEDKFTVEIKGIDECLYALSAEGARVVHVRTMNKLATKAAATARKRIKQIFNLREDDISKLVAIKASPRSGNEYIDAALRSTGRSIPLDHFQWNSSGGVPWVSILKGRRTQLPFAKILKMKNGKLGLFKEIGGVTKTGHNKIKKLFVASTPDIVEGKQMQAEVKKCFDEEAQKIFEHEFDYFVRSIRR